MRFLLLTYKPIGITLIYLVLGLLWITTSDQLAYLWFGESATELTSAQVIKGMVFVLFTALILYFLVRRLYDRLNSYKIDLNSIFANPRLAYVKISETGKVQAVSDSIKKITGYKRKEIKNKRFFELIPAKDIDVHQKILRLKRSEAGDTMSLETQLKTKDENWVWVEINASIEKNQGTHYLLSIHDISDRKKAEEELNKELREKNALINNTDDMIYSVDQKLHIVSFNKPFEKAFKKATNRQVERGDSALLNEYPEHEQRKWQTYYKRALSGEEFKVEEKIELGIDSLTFEVSFYPIRENSKVVGASIFSKDITEEIKTHEKLREREEYLQVITDHANEAIIACDLNGNLQYYNLTLKEWLKDDSPDKDLRKWGEKYQLYSWRDHTLLTPEEIPLLQILKNKPLHEFEFEIRRSGSSRVIKSSGSPLYNTKGQMIGAMSLWSDVTYLIEREVQISNTTLEALEKERSAIASELHDNLTQLLGIVSMNLKNLGLEEPLVKENIRYTNAKTLLEKAIEETRHAAYRITPKSISDFGLVVSIKELLEDYRAVNHLDIHFTYNDDRRMDNEVELNLFRIIQEAINNIVKHAEASKVNIALCFIDKDHSVQIKVEDDGKGFDPAQIDNGLGLRTMKNRADKLNGIFQIRKFDNNGMRIEVKIPLK